MAPSGQRNDSETREESPRRRMTLGWDNIHREVKHLEIDYSVREREKQISRIVDDGGFKFAIFFVAASGFLASSFSLFATNVINTSLFYVYPPLHRLDGNPSLVLDELTLLGTIIGMLFMGHFADRAGRKRLYGVELAVVIVATFGVIQASEGFMVQSSQTDNVLKHSMDIYSWLTWWRTLLGFGIGAEYPLSAVITAEWASTQSRGTMLAAVFLMQSVSRLLVDGLSLGILEATRQRWNYPNISDTDVWKIVVDQVWRWTVGIGILPAAVAIIMRLTIPETPRYYAGIMKDLRKAVKNTLMVYPKSISDKTPKPAHITAADRHGSGEDGGARWYEWYIGAWDYLTGPTKAWKSLGSISLLWAVMDVCFYGLSMDLSTDLAILVHNPTEDPCPSSPSWNPDWWNCDPNIYNVLRTNSLRFIYLASLPSVVGGIAAVLVINYFRRKHILAATFVAISILLAAAGGSLIATNNMNEGHVVTEVIYAILSFVFNLGPNTLIFVMAAEIFPTVYRGTFFGISAAMGKVGAVIIRVIVADTAPRELSLGIRLLVFIPLMLASAVLSWYLPEVQIPASLSNVDRELEEERQSDSDGSSALELEPVPGAAAPHQQMHDVEEEHQANRRSSESSFGEGQESPQTEPHAPRKLSWFGTLRNKALEDIAPNPNRDRRL